MQRTITMNLDFSKLKQTLYTAVISDVLDSLGYMHQAMRPFVRPLDERSVIMGRRPFASNTRPMSSAFRSASLARNSDIIQSRVRTRSDFVAGRFTAERWLFDGIDC